MTDRSPSPGAPRKEHSSSSRCALAAVGILVVALLLRVAASLNDFWLDEIWSLRLAQQVHQPLDVLTAIHHDNNHPLNTLCLFLLGDQPQWWVYRIPSILTGVGAVGAAGLLGRRDGWPRALLLLALTACSYLLIQYASEARGYGHAVFFTFLSLFLARRYLQSHSLRNGLLLAAGVLLGFLSHLTFLHVYAGLLAWTAWELAREGGPPLRRVADFLKPHLPVWLGLVTLYVVDVSRLTIGGRNEYDVLDVVRRTAAYTLGMPPTGALAVLALGLGALAFLSALRLLARRGSREWVFYAVTMLVSPAILLTFSRPNALFERYFLVCAACAYPLLAELFDRGLRASVAWRSAALAGAALVVGGNLFQLNTLLTYGRGNYLQAAQYLAAQTPGQQVTVASDHDFRNRMLLEYYWPYVPAGKTLVYYDREHYPAAGPEWVLQHRMDGEPEPPAEWTDPQGNRYRLERAFPHHGLSGWAWYVFRRLP